MDAHDDVPNLGPNLMVGLWLCCSLACVFLSLRLYAKFKRHISLQYDDYLLVVSWIVQLVCNIVVSINVSVGFGKHTKDAVEEYGLGNQVAVTLRETIVGFLMTLAISWSKTSFAITLLRIMQGKMRTFLWVIIVSMNVLMTIGALSLFLQCSPVAKSWNEAIPGVCEHEFNMVAGMFSSAYSALMDFVLALLPWPIIWHLRMKTKERVGIAIAMSMGMCAGATAIVKCYYLQKPHGEDFFYEGGNLVIWGSAEIATTIMAASIPVLRVLVRDIRESVAWARDTGSVRRAIKSLGRGPRRTSGQTHFAGQQPHMLRSSNDHKSTKSNLSWTGSRGITRTQDVHVSFDNRNDVLFDDEPDPDGFGHDMDRIELGRTA
ncbi:hypothetical protein F5B19DRAFT_495057 [Rostrohypoxylon terebratum]|nr:hypothetical protein F5B19DRAFT_495057 [Rostrohypoxylon terebratum]